jgi:hypothetical protein
VTYLRRLDDFSAHCGSSAHCRESVLGGNGVGGDVHLRHIVLHLGVLLVQPLRGLECFNARVARPVVVLAGGQVTARAVEVEHVRHVVTKNTSHPTRVPGTAGGWFMSGGARWSAVPVGGAIG